VKPRSLKLAVNFRTHLRLPQRQLVLQTRQVPVLPLYRARASGSQVTWTKMTCFKCAFVPTIPHLALPLLACPPPPLPCSPRAHPLFSAHPHALFSRQAILDESDDDDTAPSTTTTANVVIDVSKVLAYDSGAAGISSTAGFVRITSIRDVEADDEKTLRESCNFSMVSPLRAGFIGHEQGSSASVIQFSHLPALSAQVIGDKARSLWGLPTCLCVHAKIVACGTSLGCVVLFDHFEGFRFAPLLPLPLSISLQHLLQNGIGSDFPR
jgi:hypothetical protein